MRKLSFLMAAVWALGLVLAPQFSYAKLIEMADNELNEITGQAGIILNSDDVVEFDIQGERLSFIDDGNAFSLDNIVLQGSISNTDMRLDIFTERNDDGTVLQGFDLTMKNIDLTIDRFQTDVKLGEDTLFSYFLMNYNVQISGNMRMWAHP